MRPVDRSARGSELRAYSEFDATRGELFLAWTAILLEGQTERTPLPFVFHALGYDPDREVVSILGCDRIHRTQAGAGHSGADSKSTRDGGFPNGEYG
jgi:hypothetical protein